MQAIFAELKEEPTKEMIITAAACCLRPVENSQAPRCVTSEIFWHVFINETRGIELDRDLV